ncbi:MAG: hypothetical protein KAJ03_10195 [Gammaproteobacteria bacterium]|nr:hypothetical protein [Gammaproteobacteria bacterium]
MAKPKVWVYGTRTNKWYLVGEKDRDYAHGISQTRMGKIGRAVAKNEYLKARMV